MPLGISRTAQQRGLVAVSQGGGVGYSGSNLQDVLILLPVDIDVSPYLRTGTDKAHFSFEDIYELGKFIYFPPAQQLAQARDSRVVSDSQRRAVCVRIVYHRPKLIDLEWLQVSANALVLEEHTAAAVQLNEYRHDQKQWREEKESEPRHHNIEGAFHRV